jgi:Raf kinase inhibitor-like YbhB/YbcL family protein
MNVENLRAAFCGIVVVALAMAACSRAADPGSASEPKGETMAIKLTSVAFEEGMPIPPKHTGQGDDVSPALQWTGVPAGAKSLALICDDPDAPAGTWVHWVIWNIPPEAAGLPEAVPQKVELPDGSKQGMNDFRQTGYGGPMPPAGKAHRYFFKVYALDIRPDLKPGTTKDKLLDAMKGHLLAEGQLMGTYQRR